MACMVWVSREIFKSNKWRETNRKIYWGPWVLSTPNEQAFWGFLYENLWLILWKCVLYILWIFWLTFMNLFGPLYEILWLFIHELLWYCIRIIFVLYTNFVVQNGCSWEFVVPKSNTIPCAILGSVYHQIYYIVVLYTCAERNDEIVGLIIYVASLNNDQGNCKDDPHQDSIKVETWNVRLSFAFLGKKCVMLDKNTFVCYFQRVI